jgi:hypothetical protein
LLCQLLTPLQQLLMLLPQLLMLLHEHWHVQLIF